MGTIFKIYYHLLKPFDLIIVLVVLALSFLPNAIFAYQQATRKEEVKIYAIITIDGEEVQRIELSENTPREEFYSEPHDNQYNIIEVDGTRIRDKEVQLPERILEFEQYKRVEYGITALVFFDRATSEEEA